MVVISQNGNQSARLAPRQDICAWPGVLCALRAIVLSKRMRDEVAGEGHEIGLERLRELQGPFDARFPQIGAKVEVADLGDAEAVEDLG